MYKSRWRALELQQVLVISPSVRGGRHTLNSRVRALVEITLRKGIFLVKGKNTRQT